MTSLLSLSGAPLNPSPLDRSALVIIDARLKETGRPELILAGFMTHNCLYATAMSALDHGYRNTIVAAATGTRDLGKVPAAEVQRGALAGLSDRAAIIVPDHSRLV